MVDTDELVIATVAELYDAADGATVDERIAHVERTADHVVKRVVALQTIMEGFVRAFTSTADAVERVKAGQATTPDEWQLRARNLRRHTAAVRDAMDAAPRALQDRVDSLIHASPGTFAGVLAAADELVEAIDAAVGR
ncbi:MAG: hypothetical protein U0414_22405 [Polyangiaceae bacterium]